MRTARDRAPAEVVIGVDVGTTATKVVAFGVRSRWRRTLVREYPLLSPAPGWQVQDPGTVAAAVVGALADAVREVGGARVVAIGVSTAMHGLVGLDQDLRPLTPLVTWADSRAAAQASELHASGQAAELHRRTGTPVHPMSPLTKLAWFARHEPDLCRRVRSWVGLKDHVLRTLTGTLATELSSASGSGLLDLSTRRWDPLALDVAGVREDQLPPVLSTTAVLGLGADVAARCGLPLGTPVVAGAGDGPLGNLGTGAVEPGVVGLSLGTSGAVRAVVPAPVTDTGGRLFCYALTEDAWVVGGAVSNGGAVVRWAGEVLGRDLLGRSEAGQVDADLLELAESVPAGSDGLLALPFLLAERAPLWDPGLTGAFLGLRHSHTRAHLVRAAVEGVALQLASVVDELDVLTPVREVRATGGTLRSQLWQQVLAGALARPLHVTGGAEGSALGAAALAVIALGRSDSLLGARRLLADDVLTAPVQVDDGDVEVYRQVRASLAPMLAGYRGLAALWAEQEGRAARREPVSA